MNWARLHELENKPRPNSFGNALMPPIIENAGELLVRYDVLFCDVWGVTHDGFEAYASANKALRRFRNRGGTVILVSNAPVPAHRVHNMLKRVGVWDVTWDAIVSSGDIALNHISQMGYNKLFPIGPIDRDAALFSKLPGQTHELKKADAILCTGLNDDITESPNAYLPLLKTALDQNLPFVCANPDLVVHVGGRAYVCAGAIAELYEELGGDVFWAGKPHPSAFEEACRHAKSLRGTDIPRSRILGIGDALRTDLKAAQNAHMDALFITGGIHRDETMVDGKICPTRLEKLFESEEAPPAIAAMATLEW